MPSALAASRDYVARAIAAARAGIAAPDREGPPIKVEPFDARNASTPAGLLKLGTSIAAARRQKANFQAAQADAELNRERVRAQIARLRAQAFKDENPQPRGPARTTADVTIGGKVHPAGSLTVAEANLQRGLARDAEISGTRGRLSAAKESIKQLNARIGAETEAHVGRAMRTLSPYVAALTGTDERLRNHSLDVFHKLYGLDLSPYTRAGLAASNVMATDVATLQKAATAKVESALRGEAQRTLAARYGSLRAAHEATIGGLEGAPTARPASDADPLGVLGGP